MRVSTTTLEGSLIIFTLQVPMGILSAGGAASLSPSKYSRYPQPATQIVGRYLFAGAPSDPPGESSTRASLVAMPSCSGPAAAS